MAVIPERFSWAAELMDIRPDVHILEIGCGTGILAECICKRMHQGSFLAIDQSAPSVEKAVKRNRQFVDEGLAEFRAEPVMDAGLPPRHFDLIAAFNVNIFWQGRGKGAHDEELAMIRETLKPGGQLFVFYQSPFDLTLVDAEPIRASLRGSGFLVKREYIKKLSPTSAVCLVATR